MTASSELKNGGEIQNTIANTAGMLLGDITIKTLLESLAEGVVIINEHGRIVLINNRLSEFTGYSNQEVMGEKLDIFIPDKFRKKHGEHIHKYFSEPRIRPMGMGLDLTAKRKDNSVFPIEISLSHLETEAGRLAIGFITDISSRKKAEEELKKRNSELDAYAHTVAHDLSAPLMGIVGFSEILISDDPPVSKADSVNFLKQIAQSGRKMSSIIRELLIFASMKKEDVALDNVNMLHLVNNVCQRLSFQVKEKNAVITVDSNLLNCKGYGPWIEEVWYNYLSNAVKYGGNPPVIEVRSSRFENNFIKYSVIDNGKGIPREKREMIFKEGERDNNTEIEGYGFGLSIVKRIIEKIDGKVMVESNDGKGSVFSFYLPAE